MRRTSVLVAWMVSTALIIIGSILVAQLPQPYFTYYCAATECPSQISGGFSVWWVLIVLGMFCSVVAAIMSVVHVARIRA